VRTEEVYNKHYTFQREYSYISSIILFVEYVTLHVIIWNFTLLWKLWWHESIWYARKELADMNPRGRETGVVAVGTFKWTISHTLHFW